MSSRSRAVAPAPGAGARLSPAGPVPKLGPAASCSSISCRSSWRSSPRPTPPRPITGISSVTSRCCRATGTTTCWTRSRRTRNKWWRSRCGRRLWIAHEVAHAVRYTSPTSRADLKRLVTDLRGYYDYWDTGSRASLRELLANEGAAVAAAQAVAPGFEPWEYFGYTRRQYRRIRE